ncbi:MAG: glucan biosynthesis glucosyltransferase H [Rhodobacterales bacterium 32-66-7]|nr:MAG: glucan biosynthesis glucosyltransferase H [Rhodobacterales bacterium 32-66-7]
MGAGMNVDLRRPSGIDFGVEPLAMPDQDLGAPFRDPLAPGIRTALGTRILRLATLVTPLGLTALLCWTSLRWFALDGALSLAEGALVAVTMAAFYWVVLSVAVACLGLFWRPRPQAQALHGLTVAVLLPMYGEPAEVTIGNALALVAGLSGKGRHRFSLHVVSDTRDATAALAEESAITAARRSHPGVALTYRRRALNTDYKSGNLRHWITTEGHAFDAMLILDADSRMSPDSVVRLADAMACEPGLGLIQSLPRVLPGRTLWSRLQSFASEVYGINLGRGFSVWSGVDANFLGHNALVRTRAFATSAGLPHLPGHAPRGGVIMSHDFVEAALMRRAGWGVRMMPDAADSFEDTPETLPGHIRRDRRWCQGNMQHLRLLGVPGLHPASRFHLLQGAMAYLASVWWLALLLLWAVLGPSAMPDFFAKSPFMPSWPEMPLVTQFALATIVGVMLMAPRVIGAIGHVRDHGIRLRQMPGLVVSMLVEIGLSILIAPSLMVHQVKAVLRTLAGIDGGWMPHLAQKPDLATLARFHAAETVLGLLLVATAAAGQLSLWLMPVAVGLALTIPLSWLVQRDAGGTWLLRPLSYRT